jgi:hypothetical protein
MARLCELWSDGPNDNAANWKKSCHPAPDYRPSAAHPCKVLGIVLLNRVCGQVCWIRWTISSAGARWRLRLRVSARLPARALELPACRRSGVSVCPRARGAHDREGRCGAVVEPELCRVGSGVPRMRALRGHRRSRRRCRQPRFRAPDQRAGANQAGVVSARTGPLFEKIDRIATIDPADLAAAVANIPPNAFVQPRFSLPIRSKSFSPPAPRPSPRESCSPTPTWSATWPRSKPRSRNI